MCNKTQIIGPNIKEISEEEINSGSRKCKYTQILLAIICEIIMEIHKEELIRELGLSNNIGPIYLIKSLYKYYAAFWYVCVTYNS